MASTLRSDINVTPLVDIVLVLLIIFITMLPVLPRALGAVIPGEGRGGLNQPLLHLALARDGSLEVEGQAGVSLSAALRSRPDHILLRVDSELPLSAPVRLLDEIKVLSPASKVAMASR
jgi:biopolymer transport protein ExbD